MTEDCRPKTEDRGPIQNPYVDETDDDDDRDDGYWVHPERRHYPIEIDCMNDTELRLLADLRGRHAYVGDRSYEYIEKLAQEVLRLRCLQSPVPSPQPEAQSLEPRVCP